MFGWEKPGTLGSRVSTRLILALLLVLIGLSCATLLIVGHTVRRHVRSEINDDLDGAVVTFQNAQRQRELAMLHTARLLANLPSLKALMTTQDTATEQDSSADLWKLGGSDLLILGDRVNRIMALHVQTSAARPQAFRRETAQPLFTQAAKDGKTTWWFGDGHLYQVVLQPVYFGPETEGDTLGYLALGYEIDDHTANEVGRVAASQVIFQYGSETVASTLSGEQSTPLTLTPGTGPREIAIGSEKFLVTTVQLNPDGNVPVTLSIFKSFDHATEFLVQLNKLLLVLGTIAVLAGSTLMFFISHTLTRPLSRLIAGVRALQRGDYRFPVKASGSAEVAELVLAFDNMRSSLHQTQLELMNAERLAVIGRMAASISHDLRHQLSAIFANSEFLLRDDLKHEQREELFVEIKEAVHEMTDLLESMLELSRSRDHLQRKPCTMKDVAEHAVRTISQHPDCRGVIVSFQSTSTRTVWADARRMQRAFTNVILNACQSASPVSSPHVIVLVKDIDSGCRIEITDNGPGISTDARERIFDAFFSRGKENGTGLGLTIAQKIIQDHGGKIGLEHSEPGNTLFSIEIPSSASQDEESNVQSRAGSSETSAVEPRAMH